MERIFRRTAVIHRDHKAIQVDDCCPRRMSFLRFPWLFPIRNPSELRGLHHRSYFGPRTCGGGTTNVIKVSGVLNQGFPFSPLLRQVQYKCPISFARYSGIQVFRLYSRPSSVMDGKQRGQNGITDLTPTMQTGQGLGCGGEAQNKCVRCKQ